MRHVLFKVADVGSGTEQGRVPGLGAVTVSSLGVGYGLLAVGGLQGELLLGSLKGLLEIDDRGRSAYKFQVWLRNV